MQIIIPISYIYPSCVFVITVKPNTKEKLHGHPVVILYCAELLYGHHFTCQLLAAATCCLIYLVNMPHSADCQHCFRVAVGSEKMVVVRWNNKCNNLHFFSKGSHSQSSIVILMLQVSAVAISLIVNITKYWIEVVPGSIMSLPSVVKTLKYSFLSMFYTAHDFHQISSAINFYHF